MIFTFKYTLIATYWNIEDKTILFFFLLSSWLNYTPQRIDQFLLWFYIFYAHLQVRTLCEGDYYSLDILGQVTPCILLTREQCEGKNNYLYIYWYQIKQFIKSFIKKKRKFDWEVKIKYFDKKNIKMHKFCIWIIEFIFFIFNLVN